MTAARHILIIVTSHRQLGDSGKPTGIWLEELAVPWQAFAQAGCRIPLASPQGGAAPLDPGSVPANGQAPALVQSFLDDAQAQQALAHTRPVAELNGADFDAVFLPGGHGAMWDLPHDAGTRRAVELAWAAGKVVAAVCHGPAALVAACTPDGRPLVAGRQVSAFTNAEEDAVGQSAVVPFALESRLRELGARFSPAPLWQAHAVRDGQLITGQNPQSSEAVAALVLQALGLGG